MKKIALITALILASTSAFADGHRYVSHYHGGSSYDVLVPLVIGGVAGYAIRSAQQPPVTVIQQPQIIQQAPVIVQPRQVYIYPANVPTPYGMTCELQSVQVNGQIVTNQYCY